MNKREVMKDLLLVVLGNFVLACGVAFFIIPNSILSGGVVGIAVAIQPIFSIEPNILIASFTIVLFFVGSFFLGKGFAVKTALSSVLYPSFSAVLTQLSEGTVITNDPLLASLYGGVFIGIGIGLVFRTGASTGGMDIPPLIIHKYVRHIPVSTLVMAVDGLTVLLGLAIHGIEPALIGILSVWVSGYAINKTMMLGSMNAKSIMIISTHYEDVLKTLTEELNRGATLFDAKGVYTREEKPVIMIVIAQKEFPTLNRIVQHIDPGAFVIVSDVNEVHGEGFTFKGE